MIKNIVLAIGLSLLGIGLFFGIDRLFSDKQPVIQFTEKIVSPEFTEDLLKEAKSRGAQRFLDICTQCHITPDPKAHPAEAWPEIVAQMLEKLKAAQQTKPALVMPNTEDIALITAYLSEKSAKQK